MSQMSLFAPNAGTELERRPPDLAFIRKGLGRTLRTLRAAERLPWSPGETASREQRFPRLAAYLPAPERETMLAEFAAQLARLRAAT